MATGEVVGILPPPSYRHRQPPPPPPPPEPPSAASTTLSAAKTQNKSHQQQKSAQNNPDSQQQQRQRQGTDISRSASAAGTTKHVNNIPSVPQTAATTATLASLPTLPGGGGGGVLAGEGSPRQSAADLSYMHRPPTIVPNYGKRSRGSVLPKSNVSRVLLYDNLTQQTMLDVRINSIRSQSYKTNRELDMHMKSFMTRRKAREKALKKITRVQHMDDYVEFIQEQEPAASTSFPGIGLQKSSHKKQPITSAKSMPNLSVHASQKRAHGKSQPSHADGRTPGLNAGESREHTLPRITVSSQSDDRLIQETKNTKANNNNSNTSSHLPKILPPTALLEDNDNHDGNINRSRKVGIQFIQGDKGVTRVFKVETENSDIPTPEKSPREENSPANRSAVAFADPPNFDRAATDENNNSPATPDHNNEATTTLSKANMPHLQSRKSIFQIQKEKQQEEELLKLQEKDLQRHRSSLSDIPVDLHPEKPIIDSRFLHLRRLLVPQDPPNEGFAELSPSFPKRYPSLKDLSPRSRRKNYAKKRKERDGKNPNDSEAEFSEDESDFSTDFSDEEDAE